VESTACGVPWRPRQKRWIASDAGPGQVGFPTLPGMPEFDSEKAPAEVSS
jgi:hypothetical protein